MLEYAPVPRSAPRDLQKQDRVIARFSYYSMKNKNLDNVYTKSCKIVLTHKNRVLGLLSRTSTDLNKP